MPDRKGDKSVNTLTCQKNDVIFHQGDFAETMYEVISGEVGVYANYGGENEKELATMNEGDVFGELGLVECVPRTATAVVLSESAELREINFPDFQVLFKDRPDMVLGIMRQMSSRLRETTENYTQVCNTIREINGANKEKQSRLKQRLLFFHDIYSNYITMT